MSSNYKYQGKPLDEIAATYNTTYNTYINLDINCLNLNDYGFKDFENSSTKYIETTSNIANGLWGNDQIENIFTYGSNKVNIPITDAKSIIFNGLDLVRNNITNPYISSIYDITIKYNDDDNSIQYGYKSSLLKEEKFKYSERIYDNRYIFLISCCSNGGSGYDGHFSGKDSQFGGSGGGGSGYISFLLNIKHLKNIFICNSYVGTGKYDIFSGTGRMINICDDIIYGEPSFNINVYSGKGKYWEDNKLAGHVFLDDDMISYKNGYVTVNNYLNKINSINNSLKEYGIFILSAISGGDGGYGGSIAPSAEPMMTASSAGGSNAGNIYTNNLNEIKYSDNIKFYIDGFGYGGRGHEWNEYSYFVPGGGGGGSFIHSGYGGQGAFTSEASSGSFGSGGGGGGSNSNVVEGSSGGPSCIEIFAEDIYGNPIKIEKYLPK